MANSAKLISYIAEKSQELDLQVSQLTWMREHGISIEDVSVTIRSNGRLRNGRGSSSSSQLAIIKAFVEAAERDVMYEIGWPSSNGVAGHTELDLAKKSARAELLERHVFFARFKAGQSLGSRKVVGKTRLSQQILAALEAAGVEVLESVIEVGDTKVSLVSLFGAKSKRMFGTILGSSADPDGCVALEKALIEAARFFALISSSDECQDISEEEFLKIEKPSLRDHGRLGLNIEYADWFRRTYLQGETGSRAEEPSCNFEIVDNTNSLTKAPLYIVRANSESAAQLYVGFNGESEKPHPFW